MYTVFDYLDWRGYLSLDASPLCEVDSVILSRLSYIPFDGIVPETFLSGITLKDAAEKFLSMPEPSKMVYMEEDLTLLIKMAASRRFGHMALCGYINQFDPATEKQFCTLAIRLDGKNTFISFRGTDNTLVGWKEDFNMSFMCPVPSQESAVEYLEEAMHRLRGSFIVAGHSKGGNLAVYSSAFCKEPLQQRISKVYNFDGPGFEHRILNEPGYKRICGRVTTFIPQSSIVGMMLEHEEEYITIKSAEKISPLQHDVYSWLLMRTEFLRLETITSDARFIDHTLKDMVKNLTPQQREKFIDSVYQVFASTGAHTLKDINENVFESGKAIIGSLMGMDEETREILSHTIRVFLQSAKKSMAMMAEKERHLI